MNTDKMMQKWMCRLAVEKQAEGWAQENWMESITEEELMEWMMRGTKWMEETKVEYEKLCKEATAIQNKMSLREVKKGTPLIEAGKKSVKWMLEWMGKKTRELWVNLEAAAEEEMAQWRGWTARERKEAKKRARKLNASWMEAEMKGYAEWSKQQLAEMVKEWQESEARGEPLAPTIH